MKEKALEEWVSCTDLCDESLNLQLTDIISQWKNYHAQVELNQGFVSSFFTESRVWIMMIIPSICVTL